MHSPHGPPDANLRCEHVEADEIWSFIAKKDRNVKVDDPNTAMLGCSLRWDAETKLIPSYYMGKRDKPSTYAFLSDLRDRMNAEHRFQLTTDGFVFYRNRVEEIFAGRADFAQMIKLYGDYGQHDVAARYSPAPMIETITNLCV